MTDGADYSRHDLLRHVHDIAGLPVLFVMATDHEYGPHLHKLITPLITGVGPVEAAAATGAALASLGHAGRLPGLVLSLGTAGSRSLDHVGVYQIASVAYRDMDATALGFAPGVMPFWRRTPWRRSACASPACRPRRSRPAAISSRARLMTASKPTWSTWSPMPSNVRRSASACRWPACAASATAAMT